ncbi:hypothetical protein F4777DRAFT_542739 [Nemania sp. FL0916]|nr:hypothetical protein F4777DRAFT_542739 [Nemania sp. FL0916]
MELSRLAIIVSNFPIIYMFRVLVIDVDFAQSLSNFFFFYLLLFLQKNKEVKH